MADPIFNGENNQWQITAGDAGITDPATFHGGVIQSANGKAIDTPIVGQQALYVKSVRWVGATTAGHQAVIQGTNSKVLLRMVANAANFDDFQLVEEWWNQGFKVATLDSGVLYVNLN